MAVYKRTYKAYSGRLTPAWSRFTVLSRYGLSTLFNSRPFTAYAVLCMVPFLCGLAFIYFVHSSTAQLVLGIKLNNGLMVNSGWFLRFLTIECWMGFVLVAWAGPGMITKDLANNSVQLYLSRPLSRTEYLFGKVSVLGALLSGTILIPAILLFFLQAQLEGHGWIWENYWVAGSIIVSSLLWIAVMSLIAMAISVWVKWRIAATALMLAIFSLLPILGMVMNQILRTNLGHLINIPYMLLMIWASLFRLDSFNRHWGGFDAVPIWWAWASLLSVCAACFWLLDRKLRAREVERS
jgi:ABC-2 type transport system permease protein